VGISRLVAVLFNLPFLDNSPPAPSGPVRSVSRLRSIRCPMMIWCWNNTQTETRREGENSGRSREGGDRPPSTDHTRAVNNGVEMTYCEPHTE